MVKEELTKREGSTLLALASSVHGLMDALDASYARPMESQVLVQTTKMKVSGFHRHIFLSPCEVSVGSTLLRGGPAARVFLMTHEHTVCQQGPGAAIPHGGNFDFWTEAEGLAVN